jgi:hypothetical protein
VSTTQEQPAAIASRLAAIASSTGANHRHPNWFEHSEHRIRAFVSALLNHRGLDLSAESIYGIALLDRLANASVGLEGSEPESRLTAEDCADILCLIGQTEPTDPEAFFDYACEENEIPCPAMGLFIVLNIIERELRRIPTRRPRSRRRRASGEAS